MYAVGAVDGRVVRCRDYGAAIFADSRQASAQLTGAEPRHMAHGTWQRTWRLHDQCAPAGTIGPGMIAESTDRIRVFTIAITAPQHVHRIGARSWNQVLA